MHEGFEEGKTFLRRYDAKAEYVLRHDEFAECRRAYLSAYRGCGGRARPRPAGVWNHAVMRRRLGVRGAPHAHDDDSSDGSGRQPCRRCGAITRGMHVAPRHSMPAGEPLEAASFPADLAPLTDDAGDGAHPPPPPALLGGRPVRLWWRRDAYQRVKLWVDAEFNRECRGPRSQAPSIPRSLVGRRPETRQFT